VNASEVGQELAKVAEAIAKKLHAKAVIVIAIDDDNLVGVGQCVADVVPMSFVRQIVQTVAETMKEEAG
jgi:hypothetical protein